MRRQALRISGPPARCIAPSTPPPPRRVELAAFTMAVTSSFVMSPTRMTTRPERNRCSSINSLNLFAIARLGPDFIKHVLSTQCLCHTFRLVFCKWMFRVNARNLKHTIVNHYDSERTQSYSGRDLNFVHVVNAK